MDKENSKQLEELDSMRSSAETFYSTLNRFLSTASDNWMVDLVCPNHDGVSDNDAASDLMLLRDTIANISRGCDMLVTNLNILLDVVAENQ